MIGPRKKRSIAKKHQRNSTWRTLKLKKITKTLALSACGNCGKQKRSHHVCPHCGYYRNKQVLTIKSKTRNTMVEA